MIEGESFLLISGIDCVVCGERSLMILEWDRPLRSFWLQQRTENFNHGVGITRMFRSL